MLRADLGNGRLQQADLVHEPVQFVIADLVVWRVARTHIGVAQEVEAELLEPCRTRPCRDQSLFDPLAVRTQDSQFVRLRASQRQQDTVVIAFRRLMAIERDKPEGRSCPVKRGGREELAGGAEPAVEIRPFFLLNTIRR